MSVSLAGSFLQISPFSLMNAALADPASQAGKPGQWATSAETAASARMLARLSRRPVEALSERTETSSTWVNPDGSRTTELYAGPVRFVQAGKWIDVDVTLQAVGADGAVVPRAHPRGLRLGGQGGRRLRSFGEAKAAERDARDLVTLGSGDEQVVLQWRGGLPRPLLEGNRATYPDAIDRSADVVVEATRMGFEQYVKLKKPPTGSGGLSYTMPLKVKGLKADAQSDGSVLFAEAETGKRRAYLPAPVMWDSTSADGVSDHPHKAKVGVKVKTRRYGVDLVFTPDPGFLADPKTVWPVTVDPSTSALANVFDTRVQRGETVDWSADSELYWGNPGTKNADGTSREARAFINWKTAPIADALVSKATLSLYNFHSGNSDCAAYTWEAVDTALASTASRWTAQPAWRTTKATSTETKGRDGCGGDGWINADVTNLAQTWASAKNTTSGMGLRAPDEVSTKYWKQVNSGNAASNVPKLTVTYNYRPKTPTNPQAGPPYLAHGGVYAVNTLRPTLRATIGDANGDKVKGNFQIFDAATNTQVGDVLSSASVLPGQQASVTVPDGVLSNGKTYKFRVGGYDGTHYGTIWSDYCAFTVDTTSPSAPSAVGSTDYPSNAWVKGAGQAGKFTATPPSADHQWLEWSLDGTNWNKVVTSGAAGAKTFSVTPPSDGTQVLQIRTMDKAGNVSEPASYTFHVGPGGFDSPTEGQRTARRVPLVAEGNPTKYDKVTFAWRRSDADPWTPIPPAHIASGDTALSSWPVPLTNGKNASLAWNAVTTVNPDGNVQVRAEFAGPNGAVGQSQPLALVVDRNADGAATKTVGPGAVNLLTGNYSLQETDVSLFGMSVSRTASSRLPGAGAEQEGQAPIFGGQWVAGVSADPTDTDYSHLRKTSETSLDVVEEDGSALHFTANADQTGWVPEPGNEDLKLTGSFTGTFTLTESTSGAVTRFAKTEPNAVTWQVTTSLRAGLDDTTANVVSEAVTVDGKKLARPKRIIGASSGVASSTCENSPSTRGCRVLEFTYATATTATASAFGDYVGQVSEVRLWATKPGASAAEAIPVVRYAYDDRGHLRRRWDPRITPLLQTQYGYDDAGRVIELTPPGQLPWTFTYGSAGKTETAGAGMLLKASRPALKQGSTDTVEGDAVTALVYDVPVTGAKAPVELGIVGRSRWGQTESPTDGTAIFPSDATPASHTGDDLSAGDYRRAAITYLNASGREVNTANTASFVTTTEYDRYGNKVRALSAANRNIALGGTAADQQALTELGIANLPSAERAEMLSERTTYSDDGVQELQKLGPLHQVTLDQDLIVSNEKVAASGLLVMARPWKQNEYDAGRPTDGSAVVQDQVTKVSEGAQLPAYPTVLADGRVQTTSYDWAKGVPSATTEDPGSLSITRQVEYDSRGRETKSTQPKSSGTDAGARVTTYYSADGTGPCGGRPEWADLVCTTGPAGVITGGGSNPSELATTRTEYGLYGQPTTVTETANGATRTTTTTHDDAGRPVKTTVSGGSGAAVPETTTTYDSVTGLTTTSASPTGGTITRGYDKLGRQTSYTDADGGMTKAEYDRLGRPVKVTDSAPSTTTYTYDTAVDPRGVPTAITDSVAGTFSGRYDADGRVYEQTLPGGYTTTTTTDTAGNPVARSYTRNSDGMIVASDTQTVSIFGQATTRVGTPGGVTQQTYRYDKLGRLVQAEDTTDNICTRRSYGFDDNTNRNLLRTLVSEPGIDCPASGGTSLTSNYDSADRLVNSGYAYDAFGRTISVPGGAGYSYYANDLVRQQTAGSQRRTWQLDAAMRYRSWTTETNTSGTWNQLEAKLNHYGDDSDRPRWIVENTATGAISRNIVGLTGELAATTAKTGGTALYLNTLRGHVAVILPLDAGQAPTVIDTDEYGNQRQGSPSIRYGWLGGYQRSSETLTGVSLMGVRLYDPNTGRFLQTDPVHGGNENAYEYCTADPVNCTDLDGRISWRKLFRHFIESGVCMRLGFGSCIKAVSISVNAAKWSKGLGGSGITNAVRHFIWQGSLTFYLGYRAAKLIGDAHEIYESGNDTAKDRYNNFIARWFARAYRGTLRVFNYYWGANGVFYLLRYYGYWYYRYGYLM
ncbi:MULTISPECIES: DNRLRE domain-containing protein [Actinomadura]|uniref:DNRLRE domain-containing protein n=1 Tax=unclassified Actinomadura TaxID=2626254 RepID=UPI0033986E01